MSGNKTKNIAIVVLSVLWCAASQQAEAAQELSARLSPGSPGALSAELTLTAPSVRNSFVPASGPAKDASIISIRQVGLIASVNEALALADPAAGLTRRIIASANNTLSLEVRRDRERFLRLKRDINTAIAEGAVIEVSKNEPVKRGDIWLWRARVFLALGKQDEWGRELFACNQSYGFPDSKDDLIRQTVEFSTQEVLLLAKRLRFAEGRIFFERRQAAAVSFAGALNNTLLGLAHFFTDNGFLDPERLLSVNKDGTIRLDFSYRALNAAIDPRFSSRSIHVTNEHIAMLPKSDRIVGLDLSESSHVGNAALESLLLLPNLRWLSLEGVQDVDTREGIEEIDIIGFLQRHPAEFMYIAGDFGLMFADRATQYVKVPMSAGQDGALVLEPARRGEKLNIWIGQPGKWGYGFRLDRDDRVRYQPHDDIRGARTGFERILEDSVVLNGKIRVSQEQWDSGFRLIVSSSAGAEKEHYIVIADRYAQVLRNGHSLKEPPDSMCNKQRVDENSEDYIAQAI